MQTKNEIAVGAPVVELSELRRLYAAALEHRTQAIVSAHACGTMLMQIAEEQGELFGEWLATNAPEIQRHHAVGFIKLSQKHIENGEGPKQVLLALADKTETEENEERVKLSPHLTFVAKICQWFGREIKERPVDLWSENERKRLKIELEPIVKLHQSL